MAFVQLINPAELHEFVANYPSINIEELSQIAVYGIKRKGKIVAGFAINAGTLPFRYFKALSPQQLDELLSKHGIRLNEVVEIICHWRNPQETGLVDSVRLYFESVHEAVATRKAYVFGGSYHRAIQVIQRKALRREFYDGPDLSGRSCAIFYDTRQRIAWQVYVLIAHVLQKKVLASLTSVTLPSFKQAWSKKQAS